jgi:hypothetical protein
MIRHLALACCLAVSFANVSWATHPEHEPAGQRNAELAMRNAISDREVLAGSIADLNQLSSACDRSGEYADLRDSAWSLDERYRSFLRPSFRPEPLSQLVENETAQADTPPAADCDVARLEASAQSIGDTLVSFERAIEIIDRYMSQ